MNFVFLSPIAWDNSGGAHRPVQFARELAARGHSVTYIEIEKSRAPVAGENPRVANLEQLGWDELNLVRAWYGFEYASPQIHARWIPQLAVSERGVVICSAPFRPVLAMLSAFAERRYMIVYDVLDDISEMRALGTFCYDAIAEEYLADQSDLIVALSPRLCKKFPAHPNVTLIRDGVDLAPFLTRGGETQALKRGERTLGFWGTMWDYNLDIPLLQTLTRARPNWQWHFIGAYDLDPARPSIANALAAPNVQFHPGVSRETLAQYAKSFDVCILPTPVTPFNLARDPLKVYEYLACFKPVVATALEQLADMPYVFLSRDANEFLQNVERATQQKIDESALAAYLQEQTWAKRTDALLDALNALPAQSRGLPAAPRGAMPNAEQEADRLRAFTGHLERMVRDREQHIAELEQALQASGMTNKLRRAFRRTNREHRSQ